MTTTIQEVKFEIVPNDAGLELEVKNSLELAFAGFFQRAEEWRKQAESITDPKLARAARLEVKSLRVEAEKKRKELKEDSLRLGKAIDGANNIFLSLITPIERSLDDIEKAEERRIAAELQAKIDHRNELYQPFHDQSMPFPDLVNMDDDQFLKYLDNAKAILEIKKQAEAKAEAERIEKERIEAEAREAQRLENIKLKAEAEAREVQIAKELAESEKLRKEQEAKAKAEAEAREKAEHEARMLKEAEQARIAKEQAEIEASKKAEAEQLAKEKADAEKAASAPDKEKLNQFAELVGNLSLPKVSTKQAQEVANEIAEKVANFSKWIKSQASKL